ncbi:MAG TPA: hypothetical protein VFM80_11245 [Gracilimonas sp.]|uniref:hypothetical protein n=1 Tax=Gracilimonas sp. TaxID=1974203 RepID=UPI002D8FF6C3|nr:hypothetical protein [Gracilimonas sp.]
MKKIIFYTFFLMLLLTLPSISYAQMFSVGDSNNRTLNSSSTYVRGGISLIDFQYKGDPAALDQTGSLSFSGTAAYLAYESNGLNLGLSLGNNFSNLENRSYFSLNLNFVNPFYFIGNQNFSAGIPLKIGSKVTSVRSDRVSQEFSQNKLSVGAGLITRINVPEKFRITTQFIPSIGFSTSSGGFIGGNVFSMAGKARVNFYNLIFGRNISLGYDYNFDTYNIDGEEYDYDYSGHTLTLGISL